MREAIVLAGGKGTRLRSVVSDRPKPMADVNGRPFISIIFEWLIKNGVDRIIVSVGYKREILINYFGDSYDGIDLVYSCEDVPLMTGGAIKKAITSCVKGSDVFVVNGDSYLDVNLNFMSNIMKCKYADMVMGVRNVVDSGRYGSVKFDRDDKIVDINEKKISGAGFINGGIYLLKNNVFDKEERELFSFENDFLPEFIKTNNAYVAKTNGYFIDIGIPEDYKLAKMHFLY